MIEDIRNILRDKYTPAELVEQLGISMEDLLYYLQEYFEDSASAHSLIQEEYEELYGE